MSKIMKFLRGVISEMKKVSWPTRSELIKKTTIVIVVVAFLMAFSYVADLGISWLIRHIK